MFPQSRHPPSPALDQLGSFGQAACAEARQCRANVIDNFLDEIEIIAFGHHPYNRLGARCADDEAAAVAESLAAIFNDTGNARVRQRPPGLEPHIFQDLLEAQARSGGRAGSPACLPA